MFVFGFMGLLTVLAIPVAIVVFVVLGISEKSSEKHGRQSATREKPILGDDDWKALYSTQGVAKLWK